MMTALTNNLPDWFRRKRAKQDTPEEEQVGSASTTTGGGSDNEPVVVWEAANVMEAQVVKGRLESEGIPAIISSEAVGTIYGLTAGQLAAARVLVPAPLADKALEILFPGDAEDAENASGLDTDESGADTQGPGQ